MDKLRTVIKDGTKDLLFGECELKRNISERFISQFKKWGYNEVMTPTLEMCIRDRCWGVMAALSRFLKSRLKKAVLLRLRIRILFGIL